MENILCCKTIAHIHTDFPTKFGIPRQSGLIDTLKAQIIFEPEYRKPEAFRGLDGYSHLWLIWEFSASIRSSWFPTVRPPRLGGNQRMGVFATRSPFRPNPLGLSCVKLEQIALHTPQGPILHVSGADLMDNTPIYDIKPYLPYVDSHPEATGGFTETTQAHQLSVDFPQALLTQVPAHLQKALLAVLAHDPRPAYQKDPDRTYFLEFSDYEIGFTVDGTQLTVHQVKPRTGQA